MKKYLIIILLICATAQAESYADLRERFRHRLQEIDTSWSSISDTTVRIFINMSQREVVRMGGFIRKYTDITHSLDSVNYLLPSDFKSHRGAMTFYADSANLFSLFHNPYFKIDTNVFQYFIEWKTPDTAQLYLKSEKLYKDPIRIFYNGTAREMYHDTVTCEVPSDLIDFVVEGAIAYYYQYHRDYAASQAVWNDIKSEMGIK